MSESHETLKRELMDEEYRNAYAEDFLNTSIATQIRVLRDLRQMSQQELADRIGTKQAGISRLENVNYSAWKTETLRKLARALGVRLRITFETFGTLLDDAAQFSRESLQRPKFEDDPVFKGPVAPPARLHATPTASVHMVTAPQERLAGSSSDGSLFKLIKFQESGQRDLTFRDLHIAGGRPLDLAAAATGSTDRDCSQYLVRPHRR